MQVDSEKDAKHKSKEQKQRRQKDQSRAENVRRSIEGKPRFQRRFDQSQVKSVVDLFGGTPLNIFDAASTAEDPLKTWDMLHKKELRLAVTHPPSNYFGKSVMFVSCTQRFNI